MKRTRKISPSKYLRRYGKAKASRPEVTKEEVETVLETKLTDEQFHELIESSRMYSLKNSDKHVNLAQDAEHMGDWEGAKKHWKNAALASIKHDAHKGTTRSDKLKVRGITMRKEEVEKEVKHYEIVNTHSKNIVGKSKSLKRARTIVDKKDNEYGGYAHFHRPVYKEEFEQIDELSNETHKKYESKAQTDAFQKSNKMKDASKIERKVLDKKIIKRSKGIRLSQKLAPNIVRVPVKEEVESINELSNKTLKSYYRKADGDNERTIKKMEADRDKHGHENSPEFDKFDQKFLKRNRHMSSIKRKVYEEVEQIVELSNELKTRYIKKAEKSSMSHGIHAKRLLDRADNAPKLSIKRSSALKGFHKHITKSLKRSIGIDKAKASMKTEAIELSTARKEKVTSLLAKHQAKKIPAKTAKRYTREYTGDGLPLISAVINQEETLSETKE